MVNIQRKIYCSSQRTLYPNLLKLVRKTLKAPDDHLMQHCAVSLTDPIKCSISTDIWTISLLTDNASADLKKASDVINCQNEKIIC